MNKENDAKVESDEDVKSAGKFLSERSKKVGRDGAYLEFSSRNMIALQRNGELDLAKMVVLKDLRLDISEEDHVKALKAVAAQVADGKYNDELGKMDDEQKSFFVFRRIFEVGLLAMADACGVSNKTDD